MIHELVDKLRAVTLRDPPTARKRKNYKVVKALGQGTFGTVSLATHVPTGELVAMKAILKFDVRGGGDITHPSEKIAESVHREMAVLSALCHPNVVSLLDWFETKDKFYLVFEYASGGELYDRLATRGKFNEEDAIDLLRTLFEAVAYLHHKGIVHRDLKPENLLFRDTTIDSDVLIADFGTANFIRTEGDLLSTMCGSPMYASPEIFMRTGHSFPTDIWSMGIITFCILAGYPPFDFATDIPELVEAICHANYKFESPWWDSVSEEAKDFITHLLQIDPKKRLTIDECLAHPWLNKKSIKTGDSTRDLLAKSNLADHWPKEQPLRQRRALRTAVGAVLALNRLSMKVHAKSTIAHDIVNAVSRINQSSVTANDNVQQDQQQSKDEENVTKNPSIVSSISGDGFVTGKPSVTSVFTQATAAAKTGTTTETPAPTVTSITDTGNASKRSETPATGSDLSTLSKQLEKEEVALRENLHRLKLGGSSSESE